MVKELSTSEKSRKTKLSKKSVEEYKSLIESGVDHSVARQVLPNGMKNQLIE